MIIINYTNGAPERSLTEQEQILVSGNPVRFAKSNEVITKAEYLESSDGVIKSQWENENIIVTYSDDEVFEKTYKRLKVQGKLDNNNQSSSKIK